MHYQKIREKRIRRRNEKKQSWKGEKTLTCPFDNASSSDLPTDDKKKGKKKRSERRNENNDGEKRSLIRRSRAANRLGKQQAGTGVAEKSATRTRTPGNRATSHIKPTTSRHGNNIHLNLPMNPTGWAWYRCPIFKETLYSLCLFLCVSPRLWSLLFSRLFDGFGKLELSST